MKILDVIKCEQDNNLLVWKHPAEDFNTASTLIVHESQEAAAGKEQQSGENRTRTCSCGAILPANAKFCFECGAAQPLCCPGCGSEITPGAKFCQECGQKI